MSQKGVTLHFTETDTTMLLTTLNRLVCEGIIRAGSSGLTFVRDHVSKSLIINNTNEDVDLHLLSENTGIHGLITIVIVALSKEFTAEMRDNIVVFVFLPCLCGLEFTLHGASLSSQTFDEHTHSHT